MSKKKIAVFGGSFNPPGLHHRQIVQELAQEYDSVVVVPCGPRPDKESNDAIPPIYRAAMADVIFGGLPNVEVELFDLEQPVFTRSHALEKKYAQRGEVWHVVGSDLVAGGHVGKSEIQRLWERGHDLWHGSNFVVLNRHGHEVTPHELPPKTKFHSRPRPGSSGDARAKIRKGHPIEDQVGPHVAQYIDRNGLYRGKIPSRATHINITEPRLLIVHNPHSETAVNIAEQLKPLEYPQDPNLIVTIGGDGTMLQAIHQHWRKRVPFFGVNAGHLGFLLNNADVLNAPFPPQGMISRQMPMLYIEFQKVDGTCVNDLVFNDAWIERSTGQTAWVQVKVDGQVRLPKLVADGVLVATAAGSTAYAYSMGATPLLADTPAWLLVGSNVAQSKFKSALLSHDSEVEITSLDTDKRPLKGTGNAEYADIKAMRARVSRIAAVELCFSPTHDMAEKIAQLQFPKSDEVL